MPAGERKMPGADRRADDDGDGAPEADAAFERLDGTAAGLGHPGMLRREAQRPRAAAPKRKPASVSAA